MLLLLTNMPLSSHFDLLQFSILHPSSPSPVIFNQLPFPSCFSQCCFLSFLYHTITAYFHFRHCSLTFLTCFFVWMPLTFHVSATQVPHCCCFFLWLVLFYSVFLIYFGKSALCTALFIYFFSNTCHYRLRFASCKEKKCSVTRLASSPRFSFMKYLFFDTSTLKTLFWCALLSLTSTFQMLLLVEFIISLFMACSTTAFNLAWLQKHVSYLLIHCLLLSPFCLKT